MQINNTTDKNGVLQICESLCKLGDGGITGDTTLKAYFINYVNIAVGEVRSAMMKVDSTWKSNDYNYTDLADAPITLVLNQRDYEIPVAATGNNVATMLRVNGLYILSNGERMYLRPMEPNEVESATSGTPTAFRFIGKTIFFDCPPNADFLTNYTSFHVEYQRLDDPFVTGDTTQQPGFLGNYHHLLAFRASSLYLLPTNPQLALQYSTGKMEQPGMFESGLKRLQEDTARMNGVFDNQITAEYISHR